MAHTFPWDCWSTCKSLPKLWTKCQGTVGSIVLLGNNCKNESLHVQPGCRCFSVNAFWPVLGLCWVEWWLWIWMLRIVITGGRQPLQCLLCFLEAVRVGPLPVWLVSYNRRRFRHPEDANGVCARWKNPVRAGGCLHTMGRDPRRVWSPRHFISDSWPLE